MELIKLENDWYVFDCTYEERLTPKKAGLWWNSRTCPQKWSTNKVDKAYQLREYASKELAESMRIELEGIQNKIDESRAVSSNLDIPKPEDLDYMPFQKAGIEFCINRENVLIGDDMGLGKTIQGIGLINYLKPKNVLVVCPASLRINWINEANKWLVDNYNIHEVVNKTPVPKSANFIVTNYEKLSVKGIDQHYDLAIIDECHKVKNPKAARTKILMGYWDKKKKKNISGLIDKVDKKVFMTGTPIPNKTIEIWPVINKCDPNKFSNFMYFAKRYCKGTHNGYGWQFKGSSNSLELQRILRSSFMIRRLKEEVLKELPGKIRQLVVLPTNGCSEVVNKEIGVWSSYEANIEEKKVDVDLLWANGHDSDYKNAVKELSESSKYAFEEISAARHATALAKVDPFVEYVKEVIEQKGKVIIFAHHTDIIKKINEGLKEHNPVLLIGSMSVKKRQESVDKFQTDENTKVFIGSIGAAGVGLTLTASSTVLFAELDWVPSNITQAEDRANRIGQKNCVNVLHIVLDGSLDQKMAETIIQKQELIDQVLDKECNIDLELKLPSIPLIKSGVSKPKPKKVKKYSNDVRDIAMTAITQLRMRCDGANRKDGQGFNKFDARIGESLCNQNNLTDRQVWLALEVTRKYTKQLSNYLENDLFNSLKKAWKNNK